MGRIDVGALVLAPGFETTDPGLKPEYGYDRYPNVITSIEFERILSAAGPFEGHIKRPSDGRDPIGSVSQTAMDPAISVRNLSRRFGRFLEARRYSRSTVATYRTFIQQFLEFLKNKMKKVLPISKK